jgi:hypothetical protein
MRLSILILALIASLDAWSGVYRWIDPDGQIHYSDRPVSGADRVGIEFHRGTPVPQEAAQSGDPDADPGSYSSFQIVNPEPNQTLRTADGKVELGILIDPPLTAEHRVRILLDGQSVPGETRNTQILLNEVPFGSHRVQAQILDDEGSVAASSPLVDFHLRKPLPEVP